MIEIELTNFINDIVKSKQDILFVSSVNYEKRSLEWLKIVNRIILNNQVKKEIDIFRLSVENSGQVITILDEKAKSHEYEYKDQIELFQERITAGNIPISLKYSSRPLDLKELVDVHEMLEDIQKDQRCKEPFQIVFDITALPRRVILLMMETFAQLIEDNKAQNLYVLYTWPLRYPIAGRSTNTGSLRVENAKTSLSHFLVNVDEVHGIMTSGRDGSIGRLFLESMPPGATVDTFFHIKKDDFLYARENILENSNVFTYIYNNPRTTLDYYLSVSRGYQVVMNRIKDILHQWSISDNQKPIHALLLAPFGPKPMMITAFIGSRYSELFFKNNSPKNKSGIVHVSSLQQNDLYSIGSKETSCYRIIVNDLLGK